MKNKVKKVWLLLAVSVVLVLSACSGGGTKETPANNNDSSTNAGEPQDGGVLKVGLSANPKT